MLYMLEKGNGTVAGRVRGAQQSGAALQELGRFDDAWQVIAALELKPDFAEAHNNMGNALQDNGQLNEAW